MIRNVILFPTSIANVPEKSHSNVLFIEKESSNVTVLTVIWAIPR